MSAWMLTSSMPDGARPCDLPLTSMSAVLLYYPLSTGASCARGYWLSPLRGWGYLHKTTWSRLPGGIDPGDAVTRAE